MSNGVHKPSWFSNETVVVSIAPTCGFSRGGRPLYMTDPKSGKRIQGVDAETGEPVDLIDDQLADDVACLTRGESTDTLRFVPAKEFSARVAVPSYYDRRHIEAFIASMKTDRFNRFDFASLKELTDSGYLEVRGGHGSPPAGERIGHVPYIKVSDLRAGLVNINPTNRVLPSVAERFWKGSSSGLRPFDLLCPERTSKNIGDFCVLMPGQENVVLTKEIIILRPGPAAPFDPFYLLWAMTLNIVRNQWKRIVFMQTNREDVGKRYLEIVIPVPKDRDAADSASHEFRKYYTTIAEARSTLSTYLERVGDHHFFVTGAEGDGDAQEGDDEGVGD